MNDINCWEIKFKTCVYSNRLLNKLSALNEKAKDKIDLIKVKKSIYYAKKYHGSQLRQSGEPYYSHPLKVAYMISDYDYGFKNDILVTSILHDTIEDTKLTKETINIIFDQVIANNVELLTRIKINNKISSAEVIKLLYKQKNKDLLFIKIFDRLHNIQTIAIKSFEDKKRIIEETIAEFIILSLYLEDHTMAEKIRFLCLP